MGALALKLVISKGYVSLGAAGAFAAEICNNILPRQMLNISHINQALVFNRGPEIALAVYIVTVHFQNSIHCLIIRSANGILVFHVDSVNAFVWVGFEQVDDLLNLFGGVTIVAGFSIANQLAQGIHETGGNNAVCLGVLHGLFSVTLQQWDYFCKLRDCENSVYSQKGFFAFDGLFHGAF